MKCMFCGHLDSKVIDSRASDDGTIIKRKRECLSCAKRFITIEGVDISPILVIKNNGTRQPFDPNKIRNGVIKACEKRPVSMEKINKLVDELQKKLRLYFVKNNQTLFSEITEALECGDITLAHRLVHALKGNAGQIGKSELQDAATVVESLLKDGVSLETKDALSILENALSSMAMYLFA